MKKYKNKIIFGVAVIAVLAFVFWWGGNAPGLRGWNPQTAQNLQGISEQPITEKKDITSNSELQQEKQANAHTDDERIS